MMNIVTSLSIFTRPEASSQTQELQPRPDGQRIATDNISDGQQPPGQIDRTTFSYADFSTLVPPKYKH
jgi:hypothetical protein